MRTGVYRDCGMRGGCPECIGSEKSEKYCAQGLSNDSEWFDKTEKRSVQRHSKTSEWMSPATAGSVAGVQNERRGCPEYTETGVQNESGVVLIYSDC